MLYDSFDMIHGAYQRSMVVRLVCFTLSPGAYMKGSPSLAGRYQIPTTRYCGGGGGGFTGGNWGLWFVLTIMGGVKFIKKWFRFHAIFLYIEHKINYGFSLYHNNTTTKV